MEVEGRASNDNSLTLNLENGQENKNIPNDSHDLSTAHTIDKGILLYSQLNSVSTFMFLLIFSCKLLSYT
jgi:hypothetical protein